MNNPQEAELIPEHDTLALMRQPAGALEKVAAPTQQSAPITAAQAKVEAIANLTMQAYERAATLDLTPEEAAKLQADFPDDAFQPGAAGKENLIYIEHAHLRDRFNAVFGMGKWAIVPRSRWAEPFVIPANPKWNKPESAGERVYVEAMLVVRGCFVGEAVGAMEYYPKNNAQNYGDAVEGAKTAAFRRCAKEFGVGLQAWKKDWCEGWWKRRNAPKSRPADPAHQPKPVTPPPAKQAAPAPTQPAPAPGPAKAIEPTEKTKTWFLGQMAQFGTIARDYFVEIGVLMPGEEMTDFPVHRCPTSVSSCETIKAEIGKFYRATQSAPAAPGGATKPVEVPREPDGPTDEDPPCFEVIVPIPHKGQTRADYIKAPDTIGSLYRAMKSGDTAAQSRLWGFVSHYEPKPWTNKKTGAEMPPSKTDTDFRAALDDFADWHKANLEGVTP